MAPDRTSVRRSQAASAARSGAARLVQTGSFDLGGPDAYLVRPMSEAGGLVRLMLLSALILFVEMLLIRWVGTEIRIFAYVQNAILIACFLGLGLGCRNARAPVRLLPA